MTPIQRAEIRDAVRDYKQEQQALENRYITNLTKDLGISRVKVLTEWDEQMDLVA